MLSLAYKNNETNTEMRCKQQHLYLFSAFVFLALVAINIWYWRRRQRMTPEERRAEDAATRSDTQLWGRRRSCR
jgi:hypothetical protein